MDRWQSLIDRQIQQMIQNGETSDLPGAGRPLKLDNDTHTPPELRMAFKILRDNNMAPDWIALGRELDDKRDQLVAALKRGLQAYQAASEKDPLTRSRSAGAWQTAKQRHQETANQINKLITAYNLKVPPGVHHKALVDVDREIKRLMAGGE